VTPDADYVVGFDLGHGETAVAWVHADTASPPNVVDLPGAMGRQHITAVGVHPSRGVLIGRQAVLAAGVHPLYLGFKSPNLTLSEVHEPIDMFVRKVRDDLSEQGEIPPRGGRWIFGAPSGWTTRMRATYADLLRKSLRGTRIAALDVIPESRAALLYARDSGELRGSARPRMDQIGGCVLIIDLGSSTTDFTAVIGRRSRPFDFGSQLGASLIDRTIQRRVVAGHPQRDRLEELFDDEAASRRMELRCRMAKENFFVQLATDPNAEETELYGIRDGKASIYVEIRLTPDEMDAVLDARQPVLGNVSWREAFRSDLALATAALPAPPDVVLLTGGASRMNFVLDLTREQFGVDVVRRGAEPEVAIARGLALAGRISLRAKGFRAEITALTTSSGAGGEQIKALVVDRLPALADAIGKATADGMVERHVVPAFKRWRNNEIATLRQVAGEVADAVTAELADPDNPAILAAVANWQNEVLAGINDLTRPICVRWHVPTEAMTLEPVRVADREWRISLDLSSAVTGVIDVITGVIVGVIAMIALTAAGAAITATGGIGAIYVGALLVAGTFAGREAVLEKILDMNPSVKVRRVQTESYLVGRVRRKASEREGEVASQIARQLQKDGGEVLATQIIAMLAAELERRADDAELLIAT
jgi:hypothetical protein